jgi:hypothetical protein
LAQLAWQHQPQARYLGANRSSSEKENNMTTDLYEKIGDKLLTCKPGKLNEDKNVFLLKVLNHIGRFWQIDSVSSVELGSSFNECIKLKAEQTPSYLEEYENGMLVLQALEQKYGSEEKAFDYLLGEEIIKPNNEPLTRLEHCKLFVINELINLVIVCGGFKTWGAQNNKGYIGGSRFRNHPPYRIYAKNNHCDTA